GGPAAWGPGAADGQRRARAGGRRSPAGFDVGRVRAIEEMPEHLGLSDERGHAALLEFPAGRVADHVVDGLFRVAARPRHARPEILEHVTAHPWIVTLPRKHALLHEVRREEFRERR